MELFRHLHSLSLRWHLQRKTGEVLRVMDRGTDSINNLLNYILFSIVPTIIDIIVAVVFFIAAFNYWFGLIVFITMVLYIGKYIIIVILGGYKIRNSIRSGIVMRSIFLEKNLVLYQNSQSELIGRRYGKCQL